MQIDGISTAITVLEQPGYDDAEIVSSYIGNDLHFTRSLLVVSNVVDVLAIILHGYGRPHQCQEVIVICGEDWCLVEGEIEEFVAPKG